MPAPNPWLTKSVYPTSHFNPGATDSVLTAGPTTGKQLTASDAKHVSNVFASNPALKKIGADTVGFASGTLGILKLLLTGKALDAIGFTAYPGLEAAAGKADESTIVALAARWDEAEAARREDRRAKLLAAMP